MASCSLASPCPPFTVMGIVSIVLLKHDAGCQHLLMQFGWGEPADTTLIKVLAELLIDEIIANLLAQQWDALMAFRNAMPSEVRFIVSTTSSGSAVVANSSFASDSASATSVKYMQFQSRLKYSCAR